MDPDTKAAPTAIRGWSRIRSATRSVAFPYLPRRLGGRALGLIQPARPPPLGALGRLLRCFRGLDRSSSLSRSARAVRQRGRSSPLQHLVVCLSPREEAGERCADGTWRELHGVSPSRGMGRQCAGGPMSFEIDIPSYTDDGASSNPTACSARAIPKPPLGARRAAGFALRRRSTWSRAVRPRRSRRLQLPQPYSPKVIRDGSPCTLPWSRQRRSTSLAEDQVPQTSRARSTPATPPGGGIGPHRPLAFAGRRRPRAALCKRVSSCVGQRSGRTWHRRAAPRGSPRCARHARA